MHPLLNIAITAARQAGDIILRYTKQREHLQLTSKGLNDYFSEVDIKAEQSIINTIHKAYPQHGIIAEESGTFAPDEECVWIIDPLDGTANYIHGFPFYAVSIGVQIKNRIEHAVVYDPVRHDCFAASRGRGARCNDQRMRVSKQTQMMNSMIATSIASRQNVVDQTKLSESLLQQGSSLRHSGSIALELAYVANGLLDGVCVFGAASWDLAAGSLLVQESGGLIGDRRGGEDFLQRGEIIAGTPKVFKTLLQTCESVVL